MRISDWSSDVCSSDLTYTHLANGTILVVGSGSSTRFCRWIAQVSSDRLPLLRSLKVPFGTVQQSYRTTVIRSLEGDLFDMIGAIPIADFTPPLILAVLREIKARGAIETTKSEEHTSELQSLMRISY